MIYRNLIVFLISLSLSLTGCSIPREPEIPLKSKFYKLCNSPCTGLVIFLPGRGDTLEAFERANFIDMLGDTGTGMDAVSIDAHLGYYYKVVLAERVFKDVLEPYSLKGYDRFYLVGTSLGGYGALWINNLYPETVSGLVLIAPFLGSRSVVSEVEGAESLSAWQSSLERDPGKDDFPWIWLSEFENSQNADATKLILAFGQRDKFSRAAEVVADHLPNAAVIRSSGSHDWESWGELWHKTLASPAWLSVTAPSGEQN